MFSFFKRKLPPADAQPEPVVAPVVADSSEVQSALLAILLSPAIDAPSPVQALQPALDLPTSTALATSARRVC